MDMTWTDEQDQLRAEFRGWLAENAAAMPPNDHSRPLPELAQLHRRWQALLARDRWAAVHWPVEFGGRGLGPADRFIVEEELARAGSPELITRIGPHLAARTERSSCMALLNSVPDGHPQCCEAKSYGANCSVSQRQVATYRAFKPGQPRPRAAGCSPVRKCGARTVILPIGESAWPVPIPMLRLIAVSRTSYST